MTSCSDVRSRLRVKSKGLLQIIGAAQLLQTLVHLFRLCFTTRQNGVNVFVRHCC